MFSGLVEVKVLRETARIASPPPVHYTEVPECRLSDDLGLLFISQKFGDVTLSVSGREFLVHKAILAARSPVFQAMFEMEDMVGTTIDIPDMDYEVLREMLLFIYTGNTSNLETMANDLLAAADKYALDRLKIMCETVICQNLTLQNATETLILADLYNAENLKLHALEFICMHAVHMMETNEWKSLAVSHPHLIADAFRALATQRPQLVLSPRGRVRRYTVEI